MNLFEARVNLLHSSLHSHAYAHEAEERSDGFGD